MVGFVGGPRPSLSVTFCVVLSSKMLGGPGEAGKLTEQGQLLGCDA